MIGKVLGWTCVVSALLFALIWLGLLFGGFKPPADAGQRFWLTLALCSPLMLTLLCGPLLLILNPFE
jgi:hypothetical protein